VIEKSYVAASKKCRSGPGGIGCTCCSTFGCHPRKAKPLMRRIRRRVERLNTRAELKVEERD